MQLEVRAIIGIKTRIGLLQNSFPEKSAQNPASLRAIQTHKRRRVSTIFAVLLCRLLLNFYFATTSTNKSFIKNQTIALTTALYTVSKSASVTKREISTSEVVISRMSASVFFKAVNSFAAIPGVFFISGS